MVKMTGLYEGKMRCSLEHAPSQTRINTDAPKDNNGLGQSFSPTDLLGAALGSCILTTMAIYIQKNALDIDLKGASFSVVKKMQMSPRQVEELSLEITLPQIKNTDEKEKLEQIAHTCPVARSLNPSVKLPVVFNYTLL